MPSFWARSGLIGQTLLIIISVAVVGAFSGVWCGINSRINRKLAELRPVFNAVEVGIPDRGIENEENISLAIGVCFGYRQRVNFGGPLAPTANPMLSHSEHTFGAIRGEQPHRD